MKHIISTLTQAKEAHARMKLESKDTEIATLKEAGYFAKQDAEDQEQFVKFNRAALNGYGRYLDTKADYQDFRRPGHNDAVKMYQRYSYNEDQIAMAHVNHGVAQAKAKRYVPQNESFETKIMNCVKADGSDFSDQNFAAKAKAELTKNFHDNGYMEPTAPEVFGNTAKHTPLKYREAIQKALADTHEQHFGDHKLLEGLRLLRGTGTTADSLMRSQRASIQSDRDRAKEKKAEQVSPEEKERYKA